MPWWRDREPAKASGRKVSCHWQIPSLCSFAPKFQLPSFAACLGRLEETKMADLYIAPAWDACVRSMSGGVWWCLILSAWYGMPRLHHYIKRKPRRHYAPLDQKIETWHWHLQMEIFKCVHCMPNQIKCLGGDTYIGTFQSLFIQTFSSQQDHQQTTFTNGQLSSIEGAKEKDTERFYTVDQKRFHPPQKSTLKKYTPKCHKDENWTQAMFWFNNSSLLALLRMDPHQLCEWGWKCRSIWNKMQNTSNDAPILSCSINRKRCQV